VLLRRHVLLGIVEVETEALPDTHDLLEVRCVQADAIKRCSLKGIRDELDKGFL
jgi:hypothetical protein